MRYGLIVKGIYADVVNQIQGNAQFMTTMKDIDISKLAGDECYVTCADENTYAKLKSVLTVVQDDGVFNDTTNLDNVVNDVQVMIGNTPVTETTVASAIAGLPVGWLMNNDDETSKVVTDVKPYETSSDKDKSTNPDEQDKKTESVDTSKLKIGDIVKGSVNNTIRSGTVKSISSDMAQIDFGNGDVYGITFSRLEKEFKLTEDTIIDKADEKDAIDDMIDKVATGVEASAVIIESSTDIKKGDTVKFRSKISTVTQTGTVIEITSTDYIIKTADGGQFTMNKGDKSIQKV